jgi:two-component system OmpR family sensor kinase
MFRTLYWKLAAVMLGLFSLIGVMYVLLTLYTTRLYFQEVNQKLNRTLAENLAAEKILVEDGKINEKALQNIFHMLMVVNPGIEVYLLDPDGNIMAFSAPPGKVKRHRVSLAPLKSFLDRTSAFPIMGDDPRDPGRRKVFSVAPVPLAGRTKGYLYIILGGEKLDTVVEMLQGSYILRLSLWAVLGGLLFASLAGLLLFFRMTLRLRRLTANMESFRLSDFSEHPDLLPPFKSAAGDEIGRLGSIFSQMAERIIKLIRELRRADALRRELVANIAHDLRTPLTSLHGYLETLLLKEGKLSEQEQREYLAVALKRSNQLGKLTSALFELAKLDSPDVRVHFEQFSLAELVQDITQKFGLAAEEKKIALRTNEMENLPFVFADIALIERAFENLIENALRHTPEKGSITISATLEDERLLVQVSDTGSGIKPEDLEHLFDRSRRQSKERQKDTEGAGLGLIITKKILELHGSDIKVDSVVDAGTTFSFTLPLYKVSS